MRKIKIVKGKEASQTKRAIDIGDIAPVVLENFETLTNPKFKPRLELIEADPHNPPDMNTQTDQNIKTDGEDSKRPDAGQLAGPADYENSPGAEKEKVPHENEHVKQGAAEEDSKPDFLKKDEEEGSEDDSSPEEEKLAKLQREYTTRYTLATRLFDIKLAAGIEQEINRYNFVQTKAETDEIPYLEAQIENDQKMLNQIQASQQKTASVETRTPVIPNGFTGAGSGQQNNFNDDLEIVVMGG